MGILNDIYDTAQYEYGVGREQNREAMIEARSAMNLPPDAPRARNLLGAYRTPQAIKAALGMKLDPAYEIGREEAEVPFKIQGKRQKVGTVLGALGADITQDAGRGLYWLINAPQATGDIISEEIIARARPDLYDLGPEEIVTKPSGRKKRIRKSPWRKF